MSLPTNRKRWSAEEKREILEYAKSHGTTNASKAFDVSCVSIRNWRDPEKYLAKKEKWKNNPHNQSANRARAMKRYYKNPELSKQRARLSRKKRRFKRLVEMSNRFFPRSEWLTAFDLFCVAKKQKLICALTGVKLTNENISVDHIIPKSRGGGNNRGNIRLVDKDANLARRALSDEDFLLLCERVVLHQKTSPVERVRF